MQADLMAEKVEIDPGPGGPPLSTAQNTRIEGPRLVQVGDVISQVERGSASPRHSAKGRDDPGTETPAAATILLPQPADKDENSANLHIQVLDFLISTKGATRGVVPVASQPVPPYPARQTREDDP
jgi:hypothetical protein